MLHPRHRLATLAAIGAALPMAAPLAAQAQPDRPVSSPPAIPTSSLAGTTDATTAAVAAQDKRSPDAVDAAQGPVDARHTALIDKRSPDAVDAADQVAHRPAYTYGPVVTQHPIGRTFASVHGAPTPTSTSTSDDGTDWGQVALIAGTAAGLLAIAGGTLLATQRRSSGRRRQPVA